MRRIGISENSEGYTPGDQNGIQFVESVFE